MTPPPPEPIAAIRIRGARQHNLRGVDLDLPRGALSVITGVSGSGKSSLAFDTLYAEGQRRYVESVSTYAKQFLERLPRPDVDSITGLTPAVSIQQSATARSARSTVGTATEVHDYLRLLFARLGTVHCLKCGQVVTSDTPRTIAREAESWSEDQPVLVLAPVTLSERMTWEEQAGHLLRAGYTRARIGAEVVALDPVPKLGKRASRVDVVVDRFRWRSDERERLVEACEQAFRRGEGRMAIVRGTPDPHSRETADPRSREAADPHSREAADPHSREAADPHSREAPDPHSREAEGLTRYNERWECAHCGTPAIRPEPALFSFNSPLGVCPTCRGFGDVLTFARDRIVPDPGKTLRQGALSPWAGSWRSVAWPRLQKLSQEKDVPLDTPWQKLTPAHQKLLIEGSKEFRGVIPFLERLQQKSYKAGNRFIVKRYQVPRPCGDCGGRRLRPEALSVTLGGKNLAEVWALPVAETARFIAELPLDPTQREIAAAPLAEVTARLRFLLRVDLGYLTLDRLARTLSGGEAQRIELANALGANLADTLYVLDEPTAGLHPRDTERLIGILHELTARSNTVVVVEHDPLVIGAAQYLVDLGPGAGEHGGRLLYSGPAAGITAARGSATADYLSGEKRVTRERDTTKPPGYLVVEGATHHNLRDVTARFPLGRLTTVTGVSGSGKSSLVEDVLYRAALRHFEDREEEAVGMHRAVRGLEKLKRVSLVDQSPIGRTPRSCPVTYMGAYAALREVFARTPAAMAKGLKDGAFSFNTAGGRCDHCEGAGWVQVEMYFLADLSVPCEVCGGARFKPEVLDVTVRGANIKNVLDMTVDQAFDHFGREPKFTRPLHVLRQVGLGYLRLGQPATQLSGGEAQRLKIARELAEKGGGPSLYVLDEPTVGLHWLDIQKLLEVLDDLTKRGDTVVLVEHNTDVVRCSDWVVDLGPDGGDQGGALVAEGPPEAIAAVEASHTGRFLREAAASAGAPR